MEIKIESSESKFSANELLLDLHRAGLKFLIDECYYIIKIAARGDLTTKMSADIQVIAKNHLYAIGEFAGITNRFDEGTSLEPIANAVRSEDWEEALELFRDLMAYDCLYH